MTQVTTIESQDDNLPAIQQENSILNIIASAVANDIDVDKLERLIALQERVMNGESEKAFNAAFAKMQAEIPEIEHNKAIEHSGKRISTYARYETIVEVTRPILKKYGFAVSFNTPQPEGKVTVICTLRHEAGHSIETSLTLPNDTGGAKSAVQAVGSAVSYGKRYTLCAILNIATRGEDDEAMINDKRVSPMQKYQLEKLYMQIPETLQIAFAKKYAEPANVKKGDFTTALSWMESKVKEVGTQS